MPVAKYNMQTRDLNDVRAFVAIAQARTLSAAAKELKVPTSTVSRALTRLEKRLSTVLVQRSARGFVLTEIGREYLNTCQRAMRTLSEGENWIEGQHENPSGRLKIACPITFAHDVLTPLLKPFLARFPKLHLHVETFSSTFDFTPTDDVDVFFKIRAPQDSARRIRCYPGNGMGLFASYEYLKSAGSPETPEELSEHSCIGAGPWNLVHDRKAFTPEIKFLIEARDPHMNLRLVLDGLGIVMLPLWMARWPEICEHVAPVLPSWEVESNSLCALFFGPAHQTPKVNALLEFLDEYIGTEKDPRLRKQEWAQDLFPTGKV